MGVNYSKVICADETKKCRYGQPIHEKDYREYTAKMNDQEKNNFVCKTSKGTPRECCDPFDPLASTLVTEKTNKVKIELDKNGQYTSFLVCNCNDKACEEQNCIGFKQPTQYEKCRIRAINKEHETTLSPFVTKILPSNTYSNCYNQCKV